MDTILGWSETSYDSAAAPQKKRRASADERRPSECKRISYRNSPYPSPGSARPWGGRPATSREKTDAIKAVVINYKKSLEDLKKIASQSPHPGKVLRAIENVELEVDSIGNHLKKRVDSLGVSLVDVAELEEFDTLSDYNSSNYGTPVAEKLKRPQTSTKPSWLPPKKVTNPAIAQTTTTKVSNPTSPDTSPTLPAGIKTVTIPTSGPSKVDKPWVPGMSQMDKWATQPNKVAREILGRFPTPSKARQFIQDQLHEPEYALRDVEIRDGLWHMMDLMERLSKTFFDGELEFGTATTEQKLRTCFEEFSPETAKIIGCVASGGPQGVDGWKKLFTSTMSRRALVMAIIGNVLVEQVFEHIFFSGIAHHIKVLADLQTKHKNEDGMSSSLQTYQAAY